MTSRYKQTNIPLTKKRIAVGLSGGVDSSVTALLLKKQGHDIFGVTLKMYCYSHTESNTHSKSCCSHKAIMNAKSVSRTLGILHYVINIEDAFTARVMNPFFYLYAKGYTPNPCVECNRYVKFHEFYKKTRALGATHIATGHYAKRIQRNEKYCLLQGVDAHKDQSYFLYGLSQEMLSHTLFPLAEFKKSEVRDIARRHHLITSDMPESQEVCFVKGRTRDYLQKELKTESGTIIDEKGNKVGEHLGAALYTIGQCAPVSPGGPFYIFHIDVSTNRLYVTPDSNSLLLKCRTLYVKRCQWISGMPPSIGTYCLAQTRYQGILRCVVITGIRGNGKSITVQYARPTSKPALGQSLVLYKGKTVLGGGIINSVENS